MSALAKSRIRPAEPVARWAQRNEAKSVYDILTSAFAGDPANRWMYPDDEQYIRFFPAFAEAFGGEAFIRGTAILIEDGAGAALWLPPGSAPDEGTLAVLIEESVSERRKADLAAVIDEMSRHHPGEPHWHLAFVGVKPARQGEGHGSAMIELGLAECDRAGVSAYLEATSPRSVPLYERHGFKVIGEIRIGEFPPVFPMLRAPGPHRS